MSSFIAPVYSKHTKSESTKGGARKTDENSGVFVTMLLPPLHCYYNTATCVPHVPLTFATLVLLKLKEHSYALTYTRFHLHLNQIHSIGLIGMPVYW